VLRHIRVASKQELKDRIMAAMDEFNRHPVVHTWSYKLDKAAYRRARQGAGPNPARREEYPAVTAETALHR
jgi:hypothetical protein